MSSLEESVDSLRDVLPGVLEVEDELLGALAAAVAAGSGAVTPSKLIHKLIQEGLLPRSHAGLALLVEVRVAALKRALSKPVDPVDPALLLDTGAPGALNVSARAVEPPAVSDQQQQSQLQATTAQLQDLYATQPPTGEGKAAERTGLQVLTFDGQMSSFRCLYPGCYSQYSSSDAAREHAHKQHPMWLASLPADGHCRELRGTPSGVVSFGADGSIGDGSAARPLDPNGVFGVQMPVQVHSASDPLDHARSSDPLDQTWRPATHQRQPSWSDVAQQPLKTLERAGFQAGAACSVAGEGGGVQGAQLAKRLVEEQLQLMRQLHPSGATVPSAELLAAGVPPAEMLAGHAPDGQAAPVPPADGFEDKLTTIPSAAPDHDLLDMSMGSMLNDMSIPDLSAGNDASIPEMSSGTLAEMRSALANPNPRERKLSEAAKKMLDDSLERGKTLTAAAERAKERKHDRD